jgi:hypothetical protein
MVLTFILYIGFDIRPHPPPFFIRRGEEKGALPPNFSEILIKKSWRRRFSVYSELAKENLEA